MLVNASIVSWTLGIIALAVVAGFFIVVRRRYRAGRIKDFASKMLLSLGAFIGIWIFAIQYAIGTNVFIVNGEDECLEKKLFGEKALVLANGETVTLSGKDPRLGDKIAVKLRDLVVNNSALPLGVARIHFQTGDDKTKIEVKTGTSEHLIEIIAPYTVKATETIDYALTPPPESIKTNLKRKVLSKRWLYVEPEMKMKLFTSAENAYSINMPADFSHIADGEATDFFVSPDSTTAVRITKIQKAPHETFDNFFDEFKRDKKNATVSLRQDDALIAPVTEINGLPARLYIVDSVEGRGFRSYTFIETDKSIFKISIASYKYRMADLIELIAESFNKK